MRFRNLVGLASFFLLASGVSAWAQPEPIIIEVNGSPFDTAQDGAAISINLSGLYPSGITGTVQIRIFDEDTLTANGGVPTSSIGAVTISGTVGTSGTPLLEVLIVDGDTNSVFPSTPLEPMTVGAINFGGVSFSSTGLRDIARVAVAVAGDITGNIDGGSIRRIQARGRVVSGPSFAGGKITGNITATSPDFISDVSGGFRAIGVIWAGDEISGTITATSDDESSPGGLTWLLIGHESNTTPVGLLGDVRIDYGSIEKVHTAGPIGSSTVMPKIWAGLALHEVRVFDAASIGGGGLACGFLTPAKL
ncbi:MAG: hypothetical protein KF699_11270 [Phycisphaeraceae bacterium]|nr:hypothetical protein [Phycisphaeraceae bacterium]